MNYNNHFPSRKRADSKKYFCWEEKQFLKSLQKNQLKYDFYMIYCMYMLFELLAVMKIARKTYKLNLTKNTSTVMHTNKKTKVFSKK